MSFFPLIGNRGQGPTARLESAGASEQSRHALDGRDWVKWAVDRWEEARARELDARDELAPFRERLLIDDPELIYLDGNSLGRMPRAAAEKLGEAQARWGSGLVRGWGQGWYDLPQRLGAKIARLIGAEADEVLVCDSTSVNFFKLAVAALQARPRETRIITDNMNFPSDLYLLQGVVRILGDRHEVAVVRSGDGISVGSAELEEALAGGAALVTLSHTAFKSGFVYDIDEVNRLARAAGALTLWDLSHSVGSVPVALRESGADLAVGCTYKYLNGGPGSPAFLYVRRELQDELLSPIWGWFGQDSPFDFDLDYRPAPGIRRFMAGTPPILSMAAAEAGIDLLLQAGMDRVRAKSEAQTTYLADLWSAWLEPLGVTLNSPRDSARRGSHISIGHPDCWRINQALIEDMRVIPDFRHPDNIRLGVAPLYTSFWEIWEGMRRLRLVIEERRYERYSAERTAVT